ncbi:NAD+ synthase (glutamine-hydrolysing) [Orbus hercynius]|uniref:Glutamine-dependent NAD(+) synthetase n=1 Tax=Orbus hercynius TaxID=593135 RepID=A0A495RC47_9GAMM|nr:NAD+ synthase [Orbus hercynius]RKS85047.1 NAD+ synthase (glutamine-hydrolysing) [Orbus hercynius]
MSLSLVLAQQNFRVGDIEGNTARMIQLIDEYLAEDLLIFSELAVCGYPPEDLIYRQDFKTRCEHALERIKQASQNCGVIVGHPTWQNDKIYNSVSLFYQGEQLTTYHKQCLPNYDVFDEQRYFSSGTQRCVIDFKGHKLGLVICEDLWQSDPIEQLHTAQVELVIAVNASPYDYIKQQQRKTLVSDHASGLSAPIVYVNQIGGQDELIFDGASFMCNEKGEIIYQLKSFTEQVAVIADTHIVNSVIENEATSSLADIYQALVLATHDYVTKNGFNGTILGLSGGIDSALTLAIAVDALGKDKVQAVMMPFRYTADISIADAQEEADILGVEFNVLSIEPMFDAFMSQLTPMFQDTTRDTTEENLQARCRGVILMALSNKRRQLVLTTGNKSEMSVGYATLYGDMAGGFDVLKDVPKTLVFELSKYRNTLSYVIPERVITRPPSAELAPDQKDEDSLPPYDILDGILKGYIEQDLSVNQLMECGYDESTIRRVIKLVDINEYKRRQAAVGPKITPRNFGKGRRYPITSSFGIKNW